MYVRKILIGLILVLVTTSCVSAEKKTDGDYEREPDNPYVVKDGKLETSDLTAALQSPKSVLVIFDDFVEDGNLIRCPVKVHTIDVVCQQPGFDNFDASVVCRNPGDGTNNPKQKIKWKSANGNDTFAIEMLPSGYQPCETELLPQDYQSKHVCKLKTAQGMDIGSSEGTFVKYNINTEGCPPLDPYFIVRK